MRDVAEKAGVSITTVSHVINKTRPVSEDLTQRVLATMEQLGYYPNILARSLRRKETQTLGMILPDNANLFFAEVARRVEDASFEQGYSVILCNTDGDLEREQIYTRVLVAKQVDGILFIPAAVESLAQIRALQDHHIPVVVMDRDIAEDVDMVLTNNVRGGELATQHLIELGHRRIGYVGGLPGSPPNIERFAGYRRALEQHGIPVDKSLIVQGDFQYESGYRGARQLLTLADPPSAIFAANDLIAVGVISAAVALGLRIPEDLSIVGFDDVILAAFANPPLTTVIQPKREIGTVAVTLLLERIRNQDRPPQRRLLEPRLLVRRSTTPPGG